MSREKIEEYAHPDVLVTSDWVADHLEDFKSDSPEYRLVEVDVDTSAYEQGHIPGALGWNWEEELCDTKKRDLLSQEDFEELMESSGITPETTVILYGDNNNWFAAWALWEMKYYGHDDVRLMDGGRSLWIQEERELTIGTPEYPRTDYDAEEPDESIRTYAPEIDELIADNAVELVDVRSEAEFTGEVIAPEGMTETAQRGGHIPGATNISWSEAVNEDGTFKSLSELREIYAGRGIDGDKKTISYCRIGERSSHSWFVLRYLLGYEDVVNYDGSWTEWGNRIGAEIETGA